MTPHIFIGFDHRFKEPYEICKHSLHRHASQYNVETHKLDHKELRKLGLLNREWTVDSEGILFDNVDNRPFSTEFSHSRFLTPAFAKKLGVKDVAMFVDCDFLFQQDIVPLLDRYRALFKQNPNLSCAVVKHQYNPKNNKKMDGSNQFSFNKKLWSSFIIFNLDHEDMKNLDPFNVNTVDGRSLHNFEWTSTKSIADINESWNFIPDHSEDRLGFTGESAHAIHYTEGGPWFEDYEDCRYADLWCKETFFRNRWGL